MISVVLNSSCGQYYKTFPPSHYHSSKNKLVRLSQVIYIAALTLKSKSKPAIKAGMGKLKLAVRNIDQVFNGTVQFKKGKQLLEYQNLLLLGDIWWSKLSSIFKCCSFFHHQC